MEWELSDIIILQEGPVLFNALKNKQLTWEGGVIPYEMDTAFCEWVVV